MPIAATISKGIYKPHLEVQGRCSLKGEIKVSGAKNSALVLMAAALLSKDEVTLNNVPQLTDIEGMAEILLTMGVQISRQLNIIQMEAKNLPHVDLPYELVHGL